MIVNGMWVCDNCGGELPTQDVWDSGAPTMCSQECYDEFDSGVKADMRKR